ncbi:MAG: TIGR04282 family arsenosugar biosynthesis glycosyltransferase [Thermodesulfobacteriota bacterium]
MNQDRNQEGNKERVCSILVFAKAPIPGEVKTRLIPSLGGEAAASLHKKLVFRSLQTVSRAGLGPAELWCTPSMEDPFFKLCAGKFNLELRRQTDGDIGKRMAYAFDRALRKAPYALLIGTDCPSLTPDDLKKAFEVLAQGMDAVIGPAEDGGYVLLGLRRSAPELFGGISWGSNSVLEVTRKRLRVLGWQWHELEKRWDVDRPGDLDRLRREGYLDLMNSTEDK